MLTGLASRIDRFADDGWHNWDSLSSWASFRGLLGEVNDLASARVAICDIPTKSSARDPFGSVALPEVQAIHFTPTQPSAPQMLICGCTSCMKSMKPWDQYTAGAVGDDAAAAPVPTPLLTTDAQPGDITTSFSVTVDGEHVVSTIDTIGDSDFFSVELVEGQYYNIAQYLIAPGPSGIPLSDAYLELYDSDGDLILNADGGGPNTPQGLDALMTYQAQYTGTYYINARAFDQDGTNGTGGDAVGDYELFVQKINFVEDPYAYKPFYQPDSPLHSIDWGTQVDRTVRNPDGDNGPRDNGVPNTGVYHHPTFDISGKNVITYYFAKTGDIFLDEDQTSAGVTTNIVAQGMEQWEKDAFRIALDEYQKVVDVIYIEVDNRAEADFKFITYEGTPGVGASLLGRMSAPNTDNEGQAEFNSGDVRWTQEGLQQGGFYFPTLLHELGHGHGMAHPHDNGGHSSIMPGADGGTGGLGGGYGNWGLSQQVYTVMSYNDGWNEDAAYGERPVGHGGPRSGGITGTEVDHYGWVGTLTALDIAVLQDKYGVNEEWATGDDVYTIADENGPGKFYSCIWDAAGTDEIRYVGARNAYIDLRAATLKYEEGGGGWVSYAMGAWTGFTIANGVTIENASGGSGADELIGNDAANVLSGNDGDDIINGGAGADTMNGGAGADTLIGGAGADTYNGGDGNDVATYADATAAVTAALSNGIGSAGAAAGDRFNQVENLIGSAFDDKLYGNDGVNTIWGGAGADTIDSGAGADRLLGEGGNDNLKGGTGDDVLVGGAGADTLNGGTGNDIADYSGSASSVIVNLQSGATSGGDAQGDFLVGMESLRGSAFADTLYGRNSMNNTIDGGGGADIMWTGSGADIIVFRAGEANGDTVLDFAGNGAGVGDSFLFEGYGAGASFTQIDLTHWQIASADGLHVDIITVANGASVDASDYIFGM